MADWQTTKSGIAFQVREKLVQVVNDPTLEDYLDQTGNQSFPLATELLETYQRQIGRPLLIKRDSLAVEIVGHVFSDRLFEQLDKVSHTLHLTQTQKLMESLQRHTAIIDCGESSVDNNRIVWDRLTAVKGLIFSLTE